MKNVNLVVRFVQFCLSFVKQTLKSSDKFLVGIILSMMAMQASAVELANDTFDGGSKDSWVGNGSGWGGDGTSSDDGKLTIDGDITASKTYDFDSAYANQKVTITVRFEPIDTGMWGNDKWEDDDKLIFSAGNKGKTYTPTSGWYEKSFNSTLDANGDISMSIKPDTSGSTEKVNIDFVKIEIPFADLGIADKEAPSPDPVAIGDEVTFKITTSNSGPNDAKSDIYVRVKYSQDVELVSSHYDSGNDFSCNKSSGNLSAGSYITCTMDSDWSDLNVNKDFTFVVKPTANGTLTQTATIESTKTGDIHSANNKQESSVTVGHACGGCNCSQDHDNDSSPGVAIDGLDGATVSMQKCISGESTDGENADYYKFRVDTNGTLDIITSSPNSHSYHLKIGSSANGDEYYSDTVAENHSVDQITLEPGDTVYVYAKETGDDMDAYQIKFDFHKTSTCVGCDCQFDVGNHSAPGMTLATIDGTSVNKSICFSGTSDDGDDADYYHFKVEANGTLSINADSPNSHNFHLKIGSSSDGGEYYADTVAQEHGITNIPLTEGQEVYLYLLEEGDDTDEYQLKVDFSLEEVVQNADDICYGEITTTGMMGMFTNTIIPINNASDDNLTDTKVFLDKSSMMKFMSHCSVDDGGNGDNCEEQSGAGVGPMSMFTSGTEFDLGDSVTSDNPNHTVTEGAMFDMSGFFGGSDSILYAEYTKNGKKYIGKMKPCNPTDDTIYDALSPFVLINPDNTRNIQGNYQIAGNTVMCLTEKTEGYGGTCHGQDDYEDITSNKHVSKFLDIDSSNTTWNSTSSNILLPATYDQREGKGILWAGLFWQGRVVRENGHKMHYGEDHGGSPYSLIETGKGSGYGTLDIKQLGVNYIRLSVDDSNYTRAEAKKVHTYKSSDGVTYAAYADVTETLQSANLGKGKHTFTVANLVTEEGRESSPGLFGGWSLVVIYAEDINGKARNISTYFGFDSIDTENEPIEISGFKLPTSGKVKSALSLFSGEGEKLYKDDWVKISDEKYDNYKYMTGANDKDNIFDAILDGISRDDLKDGDNKSLSNNLQVNNNGVDIDNFDVSDIVKKFRDDNPEISEIYIKWWSEDDYITPSMFTFATELYVPELCYDYTMDIDGYVLDSTNNKIQTPFGGFGVPLTTHFFVQSLEGDISFSDINISYMLPNTSEVSYIKGSTEIAEDDQQSYEDAAEWTNGESDSGFNMFAGAGKSSTKGGTFAPNESRYIKLSSKFNKANIDTEFVFAIDYNVNYGSGDLPMHQVFTSKNLCKASGGYDITYGQFNVVDGDADVSDLKYNLYTEVARRPFKLKVVAHDPADPTKVIDHDINASVEVEFIRADHFIRDIDVTCQDEHASLESNLTKAREDAKFVHINGRSGDISYDAEDVEFAYRSMAMRIWYLVLEDGSLIDNHDCQRNNESGCVDLYKKHFPTTGECNNQCLLSSDGCYDCIRKNHGERVCSRDNFSVRPEAFVTELIDSDQNDSIETSKTRIIALSKNGGNTQSNLASGYKYRFDINATSYDSDEAVEGYIQDFSSKSESYSARMDWNPASGKDTSNCGDTAEKNITVNIFDGSTINENTKLSSVDSVDQIGEYKFKIYDSNWTSADWADGELSHHVAHSSYFEEGPDCKKASDATQKDDTGCMISSKHTGEESGSFYDLKFRFYPYKVSANGLASGAGPSMDSALIYINTLNRLLYPNGVDENMSYNIRGEISATGYNGGELYNFVDKCYAEDINMKLNYQYLSAKPAATDTPNLSFSLYNDINETDIDKKTEEDKLADSGLFVEKAKYFEANSSGRVKINIGLNYDRAINKPLNPRKVRFADINLTLVSEPKLNVDLVNDYNIDDDKKLDNNVTFIYGRAKVSKKFYDDIKDNGVNTPVSVVIYCDLGYLECLNRIPSILDAQTNESYWWKSIDHDTAKDGKVVWSLGAPTQGSGTPKISATSASISLSDGEDGDIVVSRGNNATLPLEVPIELIVNDPANPPALAAYTDRWLIYNKYDDNSVPSPFYKVRFIGNSGWTGVGKTGNVVQTDGGDRKTNRLDW